MAAPSTYDYVMVLGSFRQVQNIIKLEPTINCLLVHFVVFNSFALKLTEKSCFMEWDEGMLIFCSNPLPVCGAENLLINVLVQDHFFTDWINLNQFNNPEPIIDWFFNRVGPFSGPVYWKISFFRIKLKIAHRSLHHVWKREKFTTWVWSVQGKNFLPFVWKGTIGKQPHNHLVFRSPPKPFGKLNKR